jgi:hypothetical protein
MWTVVYIAASEVVASEVCTRLRHEGVLAKAKAIGSAKTRTEYQILVMQSELTDVRELFPTLLHDALNAVRDGTSGGAALS